MALSSIRFSAASKFQDVFQRDFLLLVVSLGQSNWQQGAIDSGFSLEIQRFHGTKQPATAFISQCSVQIANSCVVSRRKMFPSFQGNCL